MLVCALLLLTATAIAQQQSTDHLPVAVKAPHPASLEHQYWHLLRWQNHLDKVAAEHEKQGKDGTWLRDYIQKKLAFTDEEFAPIRESARRLEPKTDAIQAKAETIMKADRALRVKGQVARSDAYPGLPQLQALSEERESAIADEIETLNSELGPANAAKFKRFVEEHYTSAGPIRDSRKNPIELYQGQKSPAHPAVQP
jgi:hypothetical protein